MDSAHSLYLNSIKFKNQWLYALIFILFFTNVYSQSPNTSITKNPSGGSPPPSTILPQSTLLPTQPTPTFSLIRDTVKRFQNSRPNSPKQQQYISRRHELPYHVILVLPAKESNNDKFGLTIEKARAVIDIAVEDVIKSGIMPKNWINLTVHDSRYWEDTSLAERWSTTGVVKAYCERRLDAIFGFADSYSLATVAKVSAGFGNGIPVFTTAGLTSQIGSKKDFPFLTRMQGSYRQMADSVYQLIAYHPPAEVTTTTTTTTTTTSTTLKPSFNVSSNLNYQNLVFMYHDKRRAMNRPQASKTGEVQEQELSSHCFFAVYAIKHYFAENSEYFKESWQIQTPAVAFDEELNRTKEDVSGWLKVVSQYANGKVNFSMIFVSESLKSIYIYQSVTKSLIGSKSFNYCLQN